MKPSLKILLLSVYSADTLSIKQTLKSLLGINRQENHQNIRLDLALNTAVSAFSNGKPAGRSSLNSCWLLHLSTLFIWNCQPEPKCLCYQLFHISCSQKGKLNAEFHSRSVFFLYFSKLCLTSSFLFLLKTQSHIVIGQFCGLLTQPHFIVCGLIMICGKLAIEN